MVNRLIICWIYKQIIIFGLSGANALFSRENANAENCLH